jgi:hypothetical protein
MQELSSNKKPALLSARVTTLGAISYGTSPEGTSVYSEPVEEINFNR